MLTEDADVSDMALCDFIELGQQILLVARWIERCDGTLEPVQTVELDRRYLRPLSGDYPAKWYYARTISDPRARKRFQ